MPQGTQWTGQFYITLPGRTSRQGYLANRKAWEDRAINPVRRIKEFRDFSLEVNPGDPSARTCWPATTSTSSARPRAADSGRCKTLELRGRASHVPVAGVVVSGSIGAGSTPGYVIKGKQMPGHMGQANRTVQNLEVIQVLADDNLLLVKGAAPGARETTSSSVRQRKSPNKKVRDGRF